jgi:histidine triad (HIT) family protein
MTDCLFCRIRDGQVPARKVFEDELVLAFDDIGPQAPMHVLVIPRKHIATLNDLEPGDEQLAGHLMTVAARIARERGHAEAGWRLVMNCNRLAGQTVFHLHAHVLGGRPLEWPPG